MAKSSRRGKSCGHTHDTVAVVAGRVMVAARRAVAESSSREKNCDRTNDSPPVIAVKLHGRSASEAH